MSAPLLDPFTLATAPPLRLASDFCRFTSCVVPKEAEAGRFSPDILKTFISAEQCPELSTIVLLEVVSTSSSARNT